MKKSTMIFVVVPAFNEEEFILSTMESLHAVLKQQKERHCIVIVDDGSTDKTASVIRSVEKKFPVKLLRHAVNAGPGKAFLTGIKYVCSQGQGNDILITIEGDNTNDVGSVPQLIAAIRSGYDVSCASRYLRTGRYSNFPMFRTILSRGANTILQLLFPIQSVQDYTLFFRGYTVAILKKALAYYGNDFIQYSGFVGNTEILIKLRKIGMKVIEVPTTYDYIRRRGKSRMNITKNVFDYVTFISKFWFLR